MLPKVTISLLGWNSKKYLKRAFDSILAQDYPNIEMLFIDNASQDGSVDFVRQNFPEIKVVANQKNVGYAAGHNLGIERAQGKYVVCMNPDIELTPAFLQRAITILENHPQIGALGGKLFKMLPDGKQTDILDSTGFQIFRSRRVIDRGHGDKDQGQYDRQERVFGLSGALLVLRKKALEEIRLGQEYFDVDFENYKEDIDLCWRLNLAGWECMYAPQVVAYHERGTGLGEKASARNILLEKRKHGYRAKYFSFKNQGLLLAKNDLCRHFFADFFFIFSYELKRWGYVVLREPALLPALGKMLLQLPGALHKRKAIMSKRRLTPRLMRNFFQI